MTLEPSITEALAQLATPAVSCAGREGQPRGWVAVLMSPSRPAAVREVARSLGRSPTTVSERRADLVDERNTLVGTGLFWQVADRWPTDAPPSRRHQHPMTPILLRRCASASTTSSTRPGGR